MGHARAIRPTADPPAALDCFLVNLGWPCAHPRTPPRPHDPTGGAAARAAMTRPARITAPSGPSSSSSRDCPGQRSAAAGQHTTRRSPSEPTCNSTKRRRASSPRVEARTWKMRLAPSRQEASSQKTSARSPFQAAARKQNEAPRRARFFLAFAKANDVEIASGNAPLGGFGISAPRAAFRLHIRTGSARRRSRACAPPAGTGRHGGCQSQTHTAAVRDFAQTAPAAARHQRTRRPKLNCMIGTYGPPGRRAAILVTLAAPLRSD